MEILDIFESIGAEKKKIKLNELTAVHRTLIAARAKKEIIKEYDRYTRLYEETVAACNKCREGTESVLSEFEIPDLFQGGQKIII